MNIKYYLLLLSMVFASSGYTAPSITLCIDGDCKTRQRVNLSDESWSNVSEVFAEPVKTAQFERDCIAKAVGIIEKASLNALANKAFKYFPPEDLHNRMNNRDQALNYKSYISLLLDQRMIHQHILRKTEHRSSWVGMNEYAVVILDKTNNDLYSLDASKTDFSVAPAIISLKKWKDKKTLKRLTNNAIKIMGSSTTKFKNSEK